MSDRLDLDRVKVRRGPVPPVFDAEPHDPTPEDIANLGRMAGLDDDTIADFQRQYARIVAGHGTGGLLSRLRDRFRRF